MPVLALATVLRRALNFYGQPLGPSLAGFTVLRRAPVPGLVARRSAARRPFTVTPAFPRVLGASLRLEVLAAG